MNYWLIKSEPSTWSWNDQKKNKITMWDGVRNYQARNFIKKMKVNDLSFFYHSVLEKQIMVELEQYMWTLRIYKNRPDGSDIYKI